MLNLDWSGVYYPSRGPHMSISCPMAISNHGDSRDDNRSFSVTVTEGTSVGRCFSGNCGIKGAFWWVIREAIRARGNPPSLERWLEDVMARERPDFKSRCKRVQRYTPEFEELAVRTKRMEGRGALGESQLEDFNPLHEEALAYLKKQRGLDNDSIEFWELCWDEKRQRIVFPVRRKDGRLVGFSGRGITEKIVPKWKCYEGLVKTDHLFGGQHLEQGCIPVVVEGQIDVVVIREAVLGQAEPYVPVASLGGGFSDEQVNILRSLQPKKIILFPDGDEAGEMWAGKIYRKLKRDIPMLAQPPSFGVDPGSMTNPEILKALAEAKTILRDVKLDCLAA